MLIEEQTDPHRAGFASAGVGRHETFTPRYGWLKKGYDHFKRDPEVFGRDDAIELLGVGKNMVRAIRFWCRAFRLLEPDPSSKSRSAMKTTELAEQMLAATGWDPYLEDPASLWLLHWQLFVPPYQAASWPLAFNYCTSSTFTAGQMGALLRSAAGEFPVLSRASERGFERDASCIIRMYSPPQANAQSEIVCPFTELGLIRGCGDGRSFAFSLGPKRTLPPEVLLAASLSYASAGQVGSRSVTLATLAYGFNAPGRVFKLSETEVGRGLENAVKAVDGIYLTESLGKRLLQFEEDPDTLYWTTLQHYYREATP